jgi:hypothetical protein
MLPQGTVDHIAFIAPISIGTSSTSKQKKWNLVSELFFFQPTTTGTVAWRIIGAGEEKMDVVGVDRRGAKGKGRASGYHLLIGGAGAHAQS